MSEYGSNPPRDPNNGESGNPEQHGDPEQPGGQSAGQPPAYGRPPQYGQTQPGQDQSSQDQPGQNQPPQYGQSEPGQYGQPPYGQSQPGQYGQSHPGQPGQSQPGQGQYGQPQQPGQPEYGSPGYQPPYGQQQPGQYGQQQPGQYGQYGQPGQYGQQPGAYGSNPYGQPPVYGQYGNPMQNNASNIPANIEFASMGRRLAAQLIDGVLLSVVFAILFVLLGLALWSGDDGVGSSTTTDGTSAGETVVGLVVYAVAFLIPLVYQVTMIATRGATVGKMVLGVRVVKVEDGQVPGWVPALLRWLIPFAGSLFCGIGQIVVYLSPFFDSSGRRQGWHDMAAKTVVIRV